MPDKTVNNSLIFSHGLLSADVKGAIQSFHPVMMGLQGCCAWSDSSFRPVEEGGAAFLIMFNGQLLRYGLQGFKMATSPF